MLQHYSGLNSHYYHVMMMHCFVYVGIILIAGLFTVLKKQGG